MHPMMNISVNGVNFCVYIIKFPSQPGLIETRCVSMVGMTWMDANPPINGPLLG